MLPDSFLAWLKYDWELPSSPKDSLCTLAKNYMHFMGHRISYATVEQEFPEPHSDQDLSFLTLKNGLVNLGLSVMAVNLNIEQVKQLPLPLITCIENNLFVLLVEVEGDEVLLFSPEQGWRIESLACFDKIWSQQSLIVTSDTKLEEEGFGEAQKAYMQRLEDDPRRQKVRHIPNFLSIQDCESIIADSENNFELSEVVHADGSSDIVGDRTSLTAVLDPLKNKAVERLFNKVEHLLEVDRSHFETLQTTKYSVGQYFTLHNDGFELDTELGRKAAMESGQRIWTVIIYLNDGCLGGETIFPKLKLKIKPVKGTAIIFSSGKSLAEVDEDMLHAGLAVLGGWKIINNLWVRERPYE
jgi:prolyl 4-hydroxylase